MNTLKDKVVGSWYGMAVGDAMGLPAKSIKPETIRQLFGSVDTYKDVSPFIGKGIKRFKMQGLYGRQTQSALVIADSLLKNKKLKISEISDLLIKLSSNGPDHYFGVYRHAEKGFSQSVYSLIEEPPRMPSHNQADATFLTMGVPGSLLRRDRPEIGMRMNIDIGLTISRNLCEVTGLALTGYLASRFLLLKPGNHPEAIAGTEKVLIDAEKFLSKD